MQDRIRLCRLEFFKKLINCAAYLFDRLEYIESKDNTTLKKQLFCSNDGSLLFYSVQTFWKDGQICGRLVVEPRLALASQFSFSSNWPHLTFNSRSVQFFQFKKKLG